MRRSGSVDGLPVAPAGRHPRGALAHGARVGGDLAVLKERRHQPALALPQLAAAGEEALAGERVERHAQARRLVEGAGLLDQDLVDQLRGVDEDDGAVEDAELEDGVPLAVDAAEHAERVLLDLPGVTEERGSGEGGDSLQFHAVLPRRRSARGQATTPIRARCLSG